MKGRTVIGRGSEADVTLDDSGASRRHAEVQWDGSPRPGARPRLHERHPAQRRARSRRPSLEPDSVITHRPLAHRLPRARAGLAPTRLAGRTDPATERHDMGGFWGPGE